MNKNRNLLVRVFKARTTKIMLMFERKSGRAGISQFTGISLTLSLNYVSLILYTFRNYIR